MPKTHWCEDCRYAQYDTAWRKNSFVCTKGHRRKCADFLAKEAK